MLARRGPGSVRQVRTTTPPRSGADGAGGSGDIQAGKVDFRRERWRGHREKVRAEIVEAAFRAIDRHGPDVSLREIAAEAGTGKPKIYRHFEDKADLFRAISRRFRDLLGAAIFANVDFAEDATREVLGRAVREYVTLVEAHPNVMRFIMQDRFPEPAEPAVSGLNEGREITLAVAEMFDRQLPDMHLDRAVLELAAAAAFGSVSVATDWWLGRDPDSPRRMPVADFVAHLSTLVQGTVAGTAEMLGIDLDLDRPIRLAGPRAAGPV